MKRAFLFLICIFALSNNTISLGQNSVSQTTKGNASPAINAGRDAIYTYNDLAQMSKVLLEFLQRRPSPGEFNEDELKKELSIIYKELYETLPEEAENRAAQFLRMLPVHQHQIVLSHIQDTQVLKNKSMNLINTFDYLVMYIDTYISEIAVRSNLFSLEKVDEINQVIHSLNTNPDKILVRRIKVSDSKSIQVYFKPGSIVDDEFSKFPELSIIFTSENGKSIKNGRLKVWGYVGDGMLSFPDWVLITNQDGSFSEGTKKIFRDRFDTLLNAAIAAN